MNNKAIISISSNQGKTDEDLIEVITAGEFYKEGSYYVARYEETEISGMEGTTTTLELYENNLSLIREGTTNAIMHFKENIEELSLYDTPYGSLEIKIKTNYISINVGEEGGNALVNYIMSISGQSPQNMMLKVNIKK